MLTFINRAELVKWAEIRAWSPQNRAKLDQWIAGIPMVVGDEAVADTYGFLAASAMRRGRPRPMNDMWIAACCLTHDVPLATLNVKDFDDFRLHHDLVILTS